MEDVAVVKTYLVNAEDRRNPQNVAGCCRAILRDGKDDPELVATLVQAAGERATEWGTCPGGREFETLYRDIAVKTRAWAARRFKGDSAHLFEVAHAVA